MTQAEEVCGRQMSATLVVDADAVDRGAHRGVDVADGTVEDDDTQAALDEAEHVIERERRGAEDDAPYAVRPERFGVALFLFGIALTVAEKDLVPPRAGCRFNRLRERSPERVG